MSNPFQLIPPDTGTVLTAGIICKVSSASTNGAYTVLELSLPAGAGAPTHIHQREDEVFYILEGTCEILINGESHLAETGAMVVLPKQTTHAFRNPGVTPNRILITATPGGLDTYFQELAQIQPNDPEAAQKAALINQKYEINFNPA
jgi:mannose-6-phosphate isomerase-like protein (cupin superfamily)